jgi:hypothetical protein
MEKEKIKDTVKINGINFTAKSTKSKLFFLSFEYSKKLLEYNLIKMINGKLTKRQSKIVSDFKNKRNDKEIL